MKKVITGGISFALLIVPLLWFRLGFGGRSLSKWIEVVRRPGYRLICSREVKGQSSAIFDTGDGQIAICSSMHGPGETSVSGADGEEVVDRKRNFSVFQRQSKVNK